MRKVPCTPEERGAEPLRRFHGLKARKIQQIMHAADAERNKENAAYGFYCDWDQVTRKDAQQL